MLVARTTPKKRSDTRQCMANGEWDEGNMALAHFLFPRFFFLLFLNSTYFLLLAPHACHILLLLLLLLLTQSIDTTEDTWRAYCRVYAAHSTLHSNILYNKGVISYYVVWLRQYTNTYGESITLVMYTFDGGCWTVSMEVYGTNFLNARCSHMIHFENVVNKICHHIYEIYGTVVKLWVHDIHRIGKWKGECVCGVWG